MFCYACLRAVCGLRCARCQLIAGSCVASCFVFGYVAAMQPTARSAWVARWSGLPAVAAHATFAASLLELPFAGECNVGGEVRVMLDDEACTELFGCAAQRLADANAPASMLEGLRVGRMFALHKQSGGIRGLLMAGVFRRLVSRTLAPKAATPSNSPAKASAPGPPVPVRRPWPVHRAFCTRNGCQRGRSL